jgi:hypothetical protein
MTFRQFKWKYWYPISVDIERALRKVCIRVDRWYAKNWLIIFIGMIMLQISIAIVPIKRDYDLRDNYAHFDALSSEYYTSWRTDGKLGTEPPK